MKIDRVLIDFSLFSEAEYAAAAASTAASVTGKVLEEAFHQLCEMCGHYYQHPVTYHMRVAHPGCGGHSGSKGYNSGGNYCAGTHSVKIKDFFCLFQISNAFF